MNKKILGFFVVALVLIPTGLVATVGGKTNEENETNTVSSVKATIVKPRSGFLYVCNREMAFVGMTTIFGPRQGIEVWVDVPEKDRMNVSHIELYVNGKIAGIGNWDHFTQYYTWRCTETGIGLWQLSAKAVMDDTQGTINVGVYDQGEIHDAVSMLYLNLRFLQPKK